jgi:hypothetical protein
MSDQILRLELRLMLLKYGRAAVIATLADVEGVTAEDLEREISEMPARPRARAGQRKRVARPSKRDEAERILATNPELRRLASLYQAKMLLPSLREVKAFLAAHGVRATVKSRDDVYPRVVAVLASLPAEELARLEQSRSSSRDPEAYALLAGELMKPSDRK